MKNGWLQSDIPTAAGFRLMSVIQLLLESMIVMLNTIATSYGKYVVIRQHYQ